MVESFRPSFFIGYHGCRSDVGAAILKRGETFKKRDKSYDWLGPGVYFWENDAVRALDWSSAGLQRKGRGAEKPFVLGAIIDPGNCLDLTLRESMPLLEAAYQDLVASGEPLPENKDRAGIAQGDKLLRFLDCAVIRRLHTLLEVSGLPPFDTVRGMFTEGAEVYPGASFLRLTHTQIAVLNPDCIIEVFVPRSLTVLHGLKWPD